MLAKNSCIYCSSLMTSGALCAFCENVLFKKAIPEKLILREEGFPVFSLMSWGRENEFFVKKIVYSLKGGGSPDLLKKLISIFSYKIKLDSRVSSLGGALFVPVPGKKLGVEDHATFLSNGLALRFSGYSYPLFSQGQRVSQKTLKKKTRMKAKFSQLYPSLKLNKSVKLVICDDLVTSGATMKSMRKALFLSQNLIGLTLFEKQCNIGED